MPKHTETRLEMRFVAELLSCWLVAAFFLLAASFKLAQTSILTRTLARLPWFPELPSDVRGALAGALLGVEVFVGCALLLRFQLGLALCIATILPLMFAVGVAPFYELMGGECACVWRWVPGQPSTGIELIGRNIALASFALISLQLRRSRLGTRARLEGLPAPSGSAVVREWWLLVSSAALAVLLWGLVRSGGNPPGETEGVQVTQETEAPAVLSNPVLDGALGLGADLGRRVSESEDSGRESRTSTGLEVLVTNVEGVPVEGAELVNVQDLVTFCTADLDARLGTPPRAIVTTNRVGRAVLPASSNVRQIAILAPSMDPQLIRVSAAEGRLLTVVLHPSSGPVGIVKDSSMTPIQGARILIGCDSWGWVVPRSVDGYFDIGCTDVSGSLLLPTPSAPELKIVVAAPGSSPRRFEVASSSVGGHVELLLPATSRVRGRVVRYGAQPLVVIAEPEQEGAALPASALVENDSFAFDSLSVGEGWFLTPCLPSGDRWQAVGSSSRIVPPVDLVFIELDPGVTVRARVLDPSGEAVPPIVLRAIFPENVWLQPDGGGAREPDGAWLWSNVALPIEGHRELWVAASGYHPVSAGVHELQSGARIDLGEIHLERATTWEIRVLALADDRPIKGARVMFLPKSATKAGELGAESWAQSATSNEAGVAMLINPRLRAGVLTTTCTGWYPTETPIEPLNLDELTFVRMTKPATLLVVCSAVDGVPAVRVPLAWRAGPVDDWEHTSTGNDGRAFIEVPPGRELELRYAPGAFRRIVGGSEIVVDLSTPESDEREVLPPLEEGQLLVVPLDVPVIGELSVTVLLNGRPAAGHRVLALPHDELDVADGDLWGTIQAPRAVLDADGHCLLDDVPVGLVKLAISDPRGELAWCIREEVRASAKPLIIDLHARLVRVAVRDASGDPLPGMPTRLSLEPENLIRIPIIVGTTPLAKSAHRTAGRILLSDDEGYVSFEGVPVDASLSIGSAEPERHPCMPTVQLLPGATDASVELREGAGAALELIVTDGSGVPRPDFHVRLEALDRGPLPPPSWTDATGTARFLSLVPGDWRVRVHPGSGETTLSLVAGEFRSHVIRVEVP